VRTTAHGDIQSGFAGDVDSGDHIGCVDALGDQARPLVDHRVVELPGGVVVGIVRFDHPATEACAEYLCELHVGGNGSSHGFPPLSSRDPTPARDFLSRRRHRGRSSIERL
jgi:hypothetical protein